MLKQKTLFSVAIVLVLSAFSIHAQQAAEIFIPIGKSPGISENRSIIGTIKTVDAQKRSFTITNPSGIFSIQMSKDTQIWRDNSKLKKTNQAGFVDDLIPGRVVEVKYIEAEKARTVSAEWIKVEMVKG